MCTLMACSPADCDKPRPTRTRYQCARCLVFFDGLGPYRTGEKIEHRICTACLADVLVANKRTEGDPPS